MKIDWDYIQKHWDWLGHIVEALVMAVIVAVLFMVAFPSKTAFLLGLAFSAGHFHGREKRDYETSVKMRPPHLKGYLMWRWSWDQATDFWPTAGVVAVVALLIKYAG
ncbi:hypothetical protein ACIQUG_08140 [Ensifer sp. NPDC090286]|uniref:hypothetical protein n=1 Tax=Ensifer sp. NPDC090286 TaxID=3363991 RepID=UPI00383BA9AD